MNSLVARLWLAFGGIAFQTAWVKDAASTVALACYLPLVSEPAIMSALNREVIVDGRAAVQQTWSMRRSVGLRENSLKTSSPRDHNDTEATTASARSSNIPSSRSRATTAASKQKDYYSNVGGSIVKIVNASTSQLRDAPAQTHDKHLPITPAVPAPRRLRMNEPLIGSNAKQYIQQALDSSWLGVEGACVKKFERLMADLCGCAAGCAVQSGTAAILAALQAVGVRRREDVVICPAYTCAACADGVVLAGWYAFDRRYRDENAGCERRGVQGGVGSGQVQDVGNVCELP